MKGGREGGSKGEKGMEGVYSYSKFSQVIKAGNYTYKIYCQIRANPQD